MKSIRSLIPYVKRHRWTFLLGIIAVLATNGVGLWVPIAIGKTVNLAEHRAITAESLRMFAWGIVCLAGIAGCLRFLARRLLVDCSRDIEYEFRNDLFAKLQRLDASFFDENTTGDLMSRATNDMDALRMMIGPAVMYSCNTVFSSPMIIAGMLYLDWKLTLMVLSPMLVLPFLVKYFGARLHALSRAQSDSFADLTTMVQENLAGIRVVKAYGQEGYEERKFLERNDDYISKSLRFAFQQSLFFPSIGLIVAVGYAVLLAMGGRAIMDGRMQVGTLLSMLLLFSEMIWPLIAAGWVINIFQRGMASLDRINHIVDAEPRVADATAAKLPEGPLDIEFTELTYSFAGSNANQLQNVDLHIPAGRTLGIIGPVGCGKTTLVGLLLRFYPVERGMVRIGGMDANDWPLAELRRRIAYVSQETFLFSDTIGWNIRFGASDDTPIADVQRVAQSANVHRDIEDFPAGYDTVLGERGVNLSGGQKQRVSIARALIRNGSILILDDSMSAVDTHTEESILRELRTEMKGRTTILISHRVSTISVCDEIIVMEKGSIVQRGSHEELLAEPGMYAELYRKQLTEAAVEHFGEEPELAGAPA
jgi:ATP-binding cassette subfamily B multidrug efflux pump